MKTEFCRCGKSFGVHADFARGIVTLYIFTFAIDFYYRYRIINGVYKTSRPIERKRFQIIYVVSHKKCCSLGVDWGKWHIQFHILWYMIAFGDTGFHSQEFYEKDDLHKRNHKICG